MSRSVKIYYGLSGTFKETTIKSKLNIGDDVLWSGIKQWKAWEKLIEERNNPCDLNLALLHLSRLKDKIYDARMDETTLYVERGITDMIYYWLQKFPAKNQDTIITSLVEEELRVLGIAAGGNMEPEKILLVQKDYDFVQEVVFKEETRTKCFPGGIKDYINSQDRYVAFTKKYNNISKEIVINNAEEYLKELGITWNPEINKQTKS